MAENKITILNNDIVLDASCWNCDGTGKLHDATNPWRLDNGDCERCKGKGFQLTDEGEAIIALVKRHL